MYLTSWSINVKTRWMFSLPTDSLVICQYRQPPRRESCVESSWFIVTQRLSFKNFNPVHGRTADYCPLWSSPPGLGPQSPQSSPQPLTFFGAARIRQHAFPPPAPLTLSHPRHRTHRQKNSTACVLFCRTTAFTSTHWPNPQLFSSI